jgi:hypothetical protein
MEDAKVGLDVLVMFALFTESLKPSFLRLNDRTLFNRLSKMLLFHFAYKPAVYIEPVTA